MWHDSMVSLQHFFIRQSRNQTQKGKSSLYNVSILKTEDDTWWRWGRRKKKKDGIVLFFCFRTWWTGHCVCKSIRVHAHTQAYTHYPQTGSSVCSVRSGEMKWKSAEFDLFCLSATPQPAYFYSVISYVSQNDLTTPWELAWTCILLL